MKLTEKQADEYFQWILKDCSNLKEENKELQKQLKELVNNYREVFNDWKNAIKEINKLKSEVIKIDKAREPNKVPDTIIDKQVYQDQENYNNLVEEIAKLKKDYKKIQDKYHKTFKDWKISTSAIEKSLVRQTKLENKIKVTLRSLQNLDPIPMPIINYLYEDS